MKIDLLVSARWIVPVEPDRRVLTDHAVAVDGGRILDLLPAQAARLKYHARETRELSRHVLLPGMINAHTHAAMTLFRGLSDDLPLMNWLNEHIWPAEQKWVSPQFVEDGTRLAVAEMIRGGVTCFNDMYFFPDRAAEVAAEAGIRAVIGLILIDFPTAWASSAEEYLRKGEQVHDRFKHHPLIATAFAPHAPYSVPDGPLQRIGILAEELDVPVHMHIHETRAEIDQSLEQHGRRPLQRLQELGLLDPRLVAVHMTQLDPAEIELAGRNGFSVVHCPESNLKLASGFCPVQTLLDAGVNVALGTDGAASNNDLDMLGEMKTAALLGKGVAADSCAVDAWTALRMATLNGARALGLESITGSLVAGKEADMVAVNMDFLETQPLYDVISHLVYATGRSQVSDVWAAGRALLREGELVTLDTAAIRERTTEWQDKISSS